MTTRVYVGNLPMDIRTREVEDIFYKYGRIRDIDVKFPSRPPAFAFVDFEDPRDAEDAIRGRDGYDYDGARLRVEPANAGRRDRGDRGARYPRNIRGSGDFTVEVSNLPPRVSWQDLKDFMRKAGDVVFTEVDGRGGGVVEYSNKRDMKYAVEKLDDTEFRGRSENSYVRVREARARSGSRSASRSRSRSRSRSDRRSSKKRSRSRSAEDDDAKKARTSESRSKSAESNKDKKEDEKDEPSKEEAPKEEAEKDQPQDSEKPKEDAEKEETPAEKQDAPAEKEEAPVEKEAVAPATEAKDEPAKEEAADSTEPKEAAKEE